MNGLQLSENFRLKFSGCFQATCPQRFKNKTKDLIFIYGCGSLCEGLYLPFIVVEG